MGRKRDWDKDRRYRKALENGRENVDGSWRVEGLGKPSRATDKEPKTKGWSFGGVVGSSGTKEVANAGPFSSKYTKRRPTTPTKKPAAKDAKRRGRASTAKQTHKTRAKPVRIIPARAERAQANREKAEAAKQAKQGKKALIAELAALRAVRDREVAAARRAKAAAAELTRRQATAKARRIVPRIPAKGEVAVFTQRRGTRIPEVEVKTANGRRVRIETASNQRVAKAPTKKRPP